MKVDPRVLVWRRRQEVGLHLGKLPFCLVRFDAIALSRLSVGPVEAVVVR